MSDEQSGLGELDLDELIGILREQTPDEMRETLQTFGDYCYGLAQFHSVGGAEGIRSAVLQGVERAVGGAVKLSLEPSQEAVDSAYVEGTAAGWSAASDLFLERCKAGNPPEDVHVYMMNVLLKWRAEQGGTDLPIAPPSAGRDLVQ